MMLAALLRHELRQLRPWVFALVALAVMGSVGDLLKTPPDQLSWARGALLYGSDALSSRLHAGWLIILAVALAYSGFPRETDEGTLAFTFSLPVPRWLLFGAKFAAPALVLAGDIAFDESLRYLIRLPARTSFDGHSFRLDWQLTIVLLSVAVAWIALGYAQLLTVFRRLGLLITGLLLLAAHQLESYHPSLSALSPLNLMTVEFEGAHAILPWGALAGHGLAATLAATLAGCIWVGPLGRIATASRRWSSRSLVRWLVGFSMLGIGMAIARMVAVDADSSETEASTTTSRTFGAPPQVLVDSPEQQIVTEHFELRYPEALLARIEPISNEMEAIRQQLVERLDLTGTGHRVVVDMTRLSASHAGSAAWGNIRMTPVAGTDPEGLKRVFAHELTHVLALVASERKLGEHSQAASFFSEGLAEVLSFELFPNPVQQNALRLSAVLLAQRQQVQFKDLIRATDLSLSRGPNAVYPLGHSWVEAALAVCGQAAPTRILRTLAQPDLPQRLSPEALWQHLLQRSGCDIVAVNARWQTLLAQAGQELDANLSAIPKLNGGAPRSRDGRLVLKVALSQELAAEQHLFARVRASRAEGARDGALFVASAGAGLVHEVPIPESFAVNGSLEFQLGLRFEYEGHPVQYLKRWQSSRISP